MPQLVLEATADHVRRISKASNPTLAIVELIWNSLDAEADTVNVSLAREPFLNSIREVIVSDTGHGITPEEVTAEFGRIGDSWKNNKDRRSKNGKRQVHGSKGQGRLRAFALGSGIQWVSTSSGISGQHTITIEGSDDARNIFSWWEVYPTKEDVGTVFKAFNNSQKSSLNSLDSEDSKEIIAATFAPLLLDDPTVRISLYGHALTPKEQIVADTKYSKEVDTGDGSTIPLQVRIIEWKQGGHRQIYFGDSPGRASYVEDGRSLEAQYTFSAYVSWPDLETDSDVLALGGLAPEPVSNLRQAAQTLITDHFRERRRQTRRRQIEIWKMQGIYPYSGEPTDEAERIERTLFDVVSGTISSQVAQERLEAGLTLRLLQNVMSTRPGELIVILNEIISLGENDLRSLTDLLGTTSLSNIVRAASLVRARQHFLTALEHFIYDPVDARFIGERRHLHPMLAEELWIFGEEYHLMSSERGLTEMLRNHLRLSGLPDDLGGPVKTWEGKSGRTDLHLAVVRREHDRDRHLIVELKAPTVTITPEELGQVRKYGDVLFDDPRFQSGSASWDLILVGGNISPAARREILAGEAATGKFWQPDQIEPHSPKVTAFIRSWRDLLDENRRRLSFFADAMEHDPSVSESITFLRKQYSKLLPETLSGESAEQDSAG